MLPLDLPLNGCRYSTGADQQRLPLPTAGGVGVSWIRGAGRKLLFVLERRCVCAWCAWWHTTIAVFSDIC